MINKIAAGYGQLITKWGSIIVTVLKTILFFVMIFGLSLLIVYPLWYFATSNSDVYSSTIIILTLVGLTVFIIYRVRNYLILSELSFGGIILRKFKSFLKIAGFIFFILLFVFIFSRSIVAGIVASFIYLFLYGFVSFVIKK